MFKSLYACVHTLQYKKRQSEDIMAASDFALAFTLAWESITSSVTNTAGSAHWEIYGHNLSQLLRRGRKFSFMFFRSVF